MILSFEFPTNPKTATNETPAKPTRAAGTGSRISPTTTAKNIAKKCHAFCVNPSGAGTNHSAIATIIGTNNFKVCFDIYAPSKVIRQL